MLEINTFFAEWQALLIFSVHISYGKGKYLNQTGFFYKSCQQSIYIKAEGFHP